MGGSRTISYHPTMDQPEVNPTFAPAIAVQAQRPNTLGLAGFIVSLSGFALTGGILCPLGLLLSLIALRRAPRGFAIAGTLLGLFGSCSGCLIALFVVPVLAGAGLAAVALVAAGGPPAVVTLGHMIEIEQAITRHVEAHGTLPDSLSELNLPPESMMDGWGTPIQYQPSPQGSSLCWALQSAGPDRVLEGSDFVMRECVDPPGP